MAGEKKFLFDRHNFDEPDPAQVPEDLPPVFSEDELRAAKDDAYARGRQDGLSEAAASQQRHIADMLKTIAQSFSSLFSAEVVRERLYEEESLRLCLALIQALFPDFANKAGHAEMSAAIGEILQKHGNKAQIVLYVPPTDVGPIQEQIDTFLAAQADAGRRVDVKGDENLASGACRMAWADGGAIRNTAETARTLQSRLEALLAALKTDVPAAENNVIVEDKAPESAPRGKPARPRRTTSTPENSHE